MMSERITLLRDLLLQFDAADQRERDYRQRMLGLADGGESTLARTSYEPGHFTASAFVLNPARTHLLLIFHQKLELWLQPGGHIDPADESVVMAALREVREETGLECERDGDIGLFDIDIHGIPARADAPAHEHFDIRFLFRARTVDYLAGSDALSARWVPVGSVERVQSDESVLRAVRKLQGATLGL